MSVELYEPEYLEPANLGWMESARRGAVKVAKKEVRRGKVIDFPCSFARQEYSVSPPMLTPPILSLVPGPWECSEYQAFQLEEVRRDGTAAILRITYELELACVCFKLESDPNALIEVEPHLRRCSRVIGQLTRAAAHLRQLRSKPGSLFDD